MLVIRNPVRFHILYLIAFAQYNTVKFCRVQYREIEKLRICRNPGYEIHPGFKTAAQGRNHNRADNCSGFVNENGTYHTGSGNTRKTHALISRNGNLAHGIVIIGTVGSLKTRFSCHNLDFFLIPSGCSLYILKRHDSDIRNGRHLIRAIGTVATVMFPAQIVIDSLTPEKRLVHHPLSLASVQFGHSAVIHGFRIGIIVGISVMQRITGHFPVRVVHVNLLPGNGFLAACRLLRQLGKHPVASAEYDRKMGTRNIGISVLIARFIVRIGYVRIIRHVVIELYHSVFGLADIQFVKTGGVSFVYFFFQILRQAVCPYELATVVCRVSGSVYTSKPCIVPLLQVAAVAFEFQTRYTDILQGAFQGEQFVKSLLPVNKGTVLHPQTGQVPLAVKNDAVPADILHGTQDERLEVLWQMQTVQRGSLRKCDSGKFRAAGSVNLFQTVAPGNIQGRKVHIVHDLKSAHHGQFRSKNQFGKRIGLGTAAQNKFFQNRKCRKAHIRKAAPAGQVQLLHPFTAEKMENGSDIGGLTISIAPLHIFLYGIMDHRVPFASELEIEIACRNCLDRSTGRTVSLERYVGGSILPGAVLRVKKSHAVRYPPMAVRLTVSLHGLKVRIFHKRHLPVLVYLHTYGFRFDIFVLCVKIIDTLTKLGGLFRVEHVENGAVGHTFPDTAVSCLQLVRKLLTQVLPKYAVMTGIGIYRLVIR